MRIQCMKFLYAQYLSKIDLYKVEKNLLENIKSLNNFYVHFFCLMITIQENSLNIKKQLNRKEEKFNYIDNFSCNSVIKILSNHQYLVDQYNDRKIFFKNKKESIFFFLQELKKKSKKYKFFEVPCSSFEEEKKFLLKCYQFLFISSETWIESLVQDSYILYEKENIDFVHQMVKKTLQLINNSNNDFKLYNIYNKENKKFILNLYRNTIFHKEKFNHLINKISDNWNVERISIIDLILLQMAICEFLYFPHIPPKVTINEYIEIAKIFCMKKSTMFVNGILDKALKYLQEKNKIYKKILFK